MIVKAPTPGSVLGADAVSKPPTLFSLITMPAIKPGLQQDGDRSSAPDQASVRGDRLAKNPTNARSRDRATRPAAYRFGIDLGEQLFHRMRRRRPQRSR